MKKTHSAALGTGAVNTIKPPATKKLKLTAATAQSSAKQVVLLDSTSQSSPSLLAGLDTTTPPSSLAGAIPVIQTVNLSSKLSKSSGTGAKPSIPPGADSKSSADSATGAGEQVVKEPPVIPDKLPSAVLEKVTNLEQVREGGRDGVGCRRWYGLEGGEAEGREGGREGESEGGREGGVGCRGGGREGEMREGGRCGV